MHEYNLFSQIPAGQHERVLQILAGVTASQPTPTCDQTLIYQQQRPTSNYTVASSKRPASNKPTPGQAQQSAFVKLIRDVSQGDTASWMQRTEEVPAPGVKEMISRAVTEQVVGEKELERFRQGQGWYKYISQFLASPGHRFAHNNILIRIYRVLTVPEGTGVLEPLDAPIPTLSDCRPLDPSGTYLFEACIRIVDSANTKLVEPAIQELLAFKKLVDGAIDLRVPERLALDTRAKGT